MKMMLLTGIVFASTLLALACYGDEPGTPSESGSVATNGSKENVHYKRGKDVNFEELLIQGQLKRPEIMVVTGDPGNGTNGLLKLRENFVDRIAVDAGEEIQ